MIFLFLNKNRFQEKKTNSISALSSPCLSPTRFHNNNQRSASPSTHMPLLSKQSSNFSSNRSNSPSDYVINQNNNKN